MSIYLIKFIAILFCSMAMAAFAKAQSGAVLEIEIPFDFIVNGKNLPAGEYRFSRLNPKNPDILIVQNAAGKNKTIFLAPGLNSGAAARKNPPGLTFLRFGNIYFLNGIWASEEFIGNQLIFGVPELRRRAASASQLVRLTVK